MTRPIWNWHSAGNCRSPRWTKTYVPPRRLPAPRFWARHDRRAHRRPIIHVAGAGAVHADAQAAQRVLEFFTAQINNDHTRRAYLNATRRFAAWCDARGLHELAAVQPFHVAAFVKELQGTFAPPTVKQHLAALRMLFDWLVTGHVMEVNPAHAVRGPKYVVKKGKTPVLAADEARALLDAIDITTLTGLRDRALIGVMVFPCCLSHVSD